jgi:hypothetical protein
MITFSALVVFATATIRRERMRAMLVLSRRAEHTACVGWKLATPMKLAHEFVFRSVDEMDESFSRLVHEARTEAAGDRAPIIRVFGAKPIS